MATYQPGWQETSGDLHGRGGCLRHSPELLVLVSVEFADDRPGVLVLSGVYPSRVDPVHGVFVKERVTAVNRTGRWRMRVVSPRPYVPSIPGLPQRWRTLARVPHDEWIEGLSVERPRYLLPPKVGGYFHDQLIYTAIRRRIHQLHGEQRFSLIDSHFIYPDGVVAVRLARDLGLPVVLTARGEDILRFPKLWRIGDRIRWAHRHGTQLVALSEELASAMRANEAPADRLTVISNGVDLQRFQPIPREQARRELQLDPQVPLILGVGYTLERKGFHLAIESLPAVRARFPGAMFAIVGGLARWGQDYSREIDEAIQRTGMQAAVLQPGKLPPEELHRWYSAADVFGMLSSREGSPNAAMEALACGVPMVATPVGNIPQILADSRLGVMLAERSVPEVTRGLIEALGRRWDRTAIRAWAEQNSWDDVATRVNGVFDRAVAEFSGQR